MYRLLQRAFHDPEARSYAWVERVVWSLIGLSFVLIAIEVRRPDHAPPPWLTTLDRFVVWAFVVELVLRVGTYEPAELRVLAGSVGWRAWRQVVGRVRFLFSPFILIDMMAILAVVPALRGLRALRLLRLLRGLRLLRHSNPLSGVARAFQENALLYAFNVAFLLGVVNIGGISLFFVERGVNPDVTRVADGIWWGLVTVTTVGFGDITPVTPLGRLIGGTSMVAGMFTLALFAGTVGGTLLRALMSLREDTFRMSSYTDHIIVFGYDPSANLLLEALGDELRRDEAEVLVFGPGERPEALPNEYIWVSGDATKESELDKVKLAYARAAIIIGSRAQSIAEADARTLLVAFTLRSYLVKDATAQRRQRPLHVIAEILDPENCEHARTAGADEVVETTRFGFNLIAHAAIVPGSGNIMSRVASAGAHSLYIGPNPLEEATRYGDAVRRIRSLHRVVVIGVRAASDGVVSLNPDDATPVGVDDEIVYLATDAALGDT